MCVIVFKVQLSDPDSIPRISTFTAVKQFLQAGGTPAESLTASWLVLKLILLREVNIEY